MTATEWWALAIFCLLVAVIYALWFERRTRPGRPKRRKDEK